MKPIDTHFKYDGFTFQLIQRERDVALFEKSKPTHRDPTYEVVILQQHPEHKFPSGKIYPAREAMPPSESWGTHGFSYSDLASAKARFNNLVDRPIKPLPIPQDASEAISDTMPASGESVESNKNNSNH